jgi:hypothetical protein
VRLGLLATRLAWAIALVLRVVAASISAEVVSHPGLVVWPDSVPAPSDPIGLGGGR